MPRGAKPKGITIGFMGTGAMEVDTATTLLEDYINASVKPDEPVRFIFPLTTDEFSDNMLNLAEMAQASKIAYEVITSSTDRGRKAHIEIATGATKQYQVADIWTQMEAILVEAAAAVLVVLWDEARGTELDNLAVKFMDAGIEVRDLTNGMIVLGEEESQEGEEPTGAVPEDYEALDPAVAEAEAEDEDGNAEDAVEILDVTTSDALWTRAAMEKMSHSEVKDIAVGMGLPVRKARENMIVAILEEQGIPQQATLTGVSPVQTILTAPSATNWDGLKEVLDEFGSRFFTGLEEWTTQFIGGLEGIQFNLKPEEPMVIEEPEPEPAAPPRRRLVRQD